jgi:protein-L-isoaspartate(D-aspartate) O-methyltransferase
MVKTSEDGMKSFDRARFNMIEQQVRPWGVLDDRVLTVMGRIERERFVPEAYQGLAYADVEIPIGRDQSMLPPKLVGRMLQALAVKEGDRVLEIGTGTGYVTACLSHLGGRVTSVEIDADLADGARSRLADLGLERCEVHSADGMADKNDGAPFDVIAVTGSMPTDEPLAMLREQLADGGRLFVVVGEAPIMEALLVTHFSRGEYRREALFETAIPALQNVPEPERFVF